MTDTSNRDSALEIQLTGGGNIQLKLLRVEAEEAFSRHFAISVEAISLGDVELLPNLGKPAAITCKLEGTQARYFHGLVGHAEYVRMDTKGHIYRLTLFPRLFFHERGSNYRIFQDKSVRDIITEILDGLAVDYDYKASRGDRMLPYCVQYGESDFDFISRQMEEEGLYYFYEHTDTKHVLTICDAPANHVGMSPDTFEFVPPTHALDIADSVETQGYTAKFVQLFLEYASTGAELKASMRDYDFKNPHPELEAEKLEEGDHDEDAEDVYQWPGRFYDPAYGNSLSEVLVQSRRAQRLSYEGRTFYPGMVYGKTFSLTRHDTDRLNAKYLVIGCRTVLADEVYLSGDASLETSVEFTAIPDSVAYRAPIETPRPIVHGPETAFVAGPAGEEIYVDEYGRVKVEFHWDRRDQYNESSSCWLRVSQLSLLGSIFNPRIGQEVIVNFMNGNPDRPVITGFLYNDDNKPLYELPEHKTRSVIRTKTYQRDSGASGVGAQDLDSGAPGANEIRFEDKTDEEELYVHAEKDMNTRIRNNETHKVGTDVEVYVGNDRQTEIEHDDTLDVGNTLKIDAGNEIQMTATNKITITCGQSSITLTPTEIKIQTPTLTAKGDMSATLKSGLSVTVDGGVSTVVKAGIVKIN
ncbi:MAG: type VI secretion system tip protein VgrG [Novosphingobium sp.]|nr:type VI secretion system tip protein VgrG [Novosphingobium sp.]